MSIARRCDRCKKLDTLSDPPARGSQFGMDFRRLPTLEHYDPATDSRASWDLCKDCYELFTTWVWCSPENLADPPPKSVSNFCPECKVDLRFAQHRTTCTAMGAIGAKQ